MSNQRAKSQSDKIKVLREEVDDLIAKQGKSAAKTVVTETKPIQLPQGTDIDMNQLAQLFASKDSITSLEKRLGAVEQQNKQQDKTIGGHGDRISKLE